MFTSPNPKKTAWKKSSNISVASQLLSKIILVKAIYDQYYIAYSTLHDDSCY